MLTKIVARRIQPYVDGDKEGFRKEIHKEADRLAKTPFGVPLMHIIAYVPSHAEISVTKLCQVAVSMPSMLLCFMSGWLVAGNTERRSSDLLQFHPCVLVGLSHRVLFRNKSTVVTTNSGLRLCLLCRYGYARAAKPHLGYAIAEFFTRLGHTITGSVSLPTTSNVFPPQLGLLHAQDIPRMIASWRAQDILDIITVVMLLLLRHDCHAGAFGEALHQFG